MNVEMWENAATQRNVVALRDDGVAILGPARATRPAAKSAWAACSKRQEIAAEIEAFFQPKALAGVRVLVTAGPTESRSTRCAGSPTELGKDGLRGRARGRDAGARGDARVRARSRWRRRQASSASTCARPQRCSRR